MEKKLEKIINLSKMILNKGYGVLFLGDRGIGKTEVAKKIAFELNRELVYLNVSQLYPENIIFPVNNNNTLDVISYDFEGKIVLLDELTNASREMYSLLQSFVLDKQLLNRQYRDVIFIATGNKAEHSSAVNIVPRPLLERFVVIDFPVPSKEEWSIYTLTKGGSNKFVSFLLQANYDLYYSEENIGEADDFEQKPSPRNNTRTAILLGELENSGLEDYDLIRTIVSGSSGNKVSEGYIQYLQSGRYYSYDLYVTGEMPKKDSEAISFANDIASRYKNDSLSIKEIDKIFGKVFDNLFPKYKDYLIELLKAINIAELKAFIDETIYESNGEMTSNSNIGKFVLERIKVLKKYNL